IELGEIEAALQSEAEVKEAVVIVREDALVAYVVSGRASGDLRTALREKLPEYMVPSAFIFLEELPLTPNGKVDRKALPAPETDLSATSSIAPRTPVEEILCGIWAEVLGVKGVGVDANFFEVGGHSLKATQVISRIRESFQVELPLRTIFEAPTIEMLAASVERALGAGTQRESLALRAVPREGPVGLSFAQQRLWFLNELEPESTAYNIVRALRLRGALNVAALKAALTEIVRRHEALRTRFAVEAEQPVQVISTETNFSVAHISITEAEVRRFIEKEANQPFDLRAGSLFRASLLRLDSEEHVLVLAMHHIISDAWSAGVFFRELSALYAAYAASEESPLPELPVQYADYAVWQRGWLQGEVLDQQLVYWRERLTGAALVLELPADRVRPAVQSYRGAAARFEVSREVSEGLKELSQREGVTLFMTLLAAFKVLLYRYTGQADIVVGSPIAGRTRAEVENLIGFFVNTLVLRTDLSGGPGFRELLGRVRETALGAYAHQDVPFEKLVEELQPERDLSRSPLFQVMFALQNAPQESLRLEGLTLSYLKTESGVAKFDLSLFMADSSEGIKGALEYNTDLFERETVERLLGHFRILLEAIVGEPQRAVTELPLLSEAERQQLLVEWNETEVEAG
ncbi:MAG TPA: condensation domain-containing protein, partial [Pyrinomonadaceae bacterium]|nr:condensation domain-containing protein [Pyrinomonadaceae bacterium]